MVKSMPKMFIVQNMKVVPSAEKNQGLIRFGYLLGREKKHYVFVGGETLLPL